MFENFRLSIALQKQIAGVLLALVAYVVQTYATPELASVLEDHAIPLIIGLVFVIFGVDLTDLARQNKEKKNEETA